MTDISEIIKELKKQGLFTEGGIEALFSALSKKLAASAPPKKDKIVLSEEHQELLPIPVSVCRGIQLDYLNRIVIVVYIPSNELQITSKMIPSLLQSTFYLYSLYAVQSPLSFTIALSCSPYQPAHFIFNFF